jgi:NAD-dependent SIR2 family protein deacetylase
MALVELQNRGILKYLVSQNCDGLHRISGILPVSLPQLTQRWADLISNRGGYQSFTETATESIAKIAGKITFEVTLQLLQSRNHHAYLG